MKRMLVWLSLAVLLLPRLALAEVDPLVREAEARRIAVMQSVEPSVVAIFSADGGGGGSGVIITPDGYALSNFHVTKPSGAWMKCGLADGSYLDAVLVGLDPTGDVALIKLLGREKFPFAEMADSDRMRVGQWVFAMGNPFLLATDFRPTVTYGIVSGIHRYQPPAGSFLEYADCLQIDASINPGNSGGPLFNSDGKLIGINGRGSFEKRGRVNVGVAYAISINQIKKFLGALRGGRVVDHASLGAVVASDGEGRVVISDILETSDAYRRGLRYGDEVLSFAGRPIRTVNAFKNALGVLPDGWRVPLEYRRRGETQRVFVRLTRMHTEAELAQVVAGPGVPDPDKPNDEEEGGPKLPKLPEGDREKEAPPEGEHPVPKQLPIGGGRQAKEMPQAVKALYAERDGFANFHFNEVELARVLKSLYGQGDFAPWTGAWRLKGELATAGDAEFTLDDKTVKAVLPGGQLRLDISDDLTAARDPADSGGLMAALHFWRQLLLRGPAGFDQLAYQGEAPLPIGDALYDVLLGQAAGTRARCYLDKQSGRLAALELFLAADEDPCELYFRAYHDQEGRAIPGEIECRYGDEIYGVFHFPEFAVLKQSER
jgi:S1-C subfamily serine protease